MAQLFETRLTLEQKDILTRFAQAMLAGAAKRPQCTGVLWQRGLISENTYERFSSCAFGAAWEGDHPAFNPAVWIEYLNTGLNDIVYHFDLYRLPLVNNPATGVRGEHLRAVIIDLNDKYRWTREQIAEWLLMLAADG